MMWKAMKQDLNKSPTMNLHDPPHKVKARYVTFGILAVNKQNCMNLKEEHFSRSCLDMIWFAQTGLKSLEYNTY